MTAKLDTRVVYGAVCTWWDDIHQVGKNPAGLPCCPHCGGVLFEQPSMGSFIKGADEYDGTHPGYLNILLWARGRCFKSPDAMAKAYRTRNHSGPFSREFLAK